MHSRCEGIPFHDVDNILNLKNNFKKLKYILDISFNHVFNFGSLVYQELKSGVEKSPLVILSPMLPMVSSHGLR